MNTPITICLTAYRRPAYLAQALESIRLASANYPDSKLVISIEGESPQETHDLAHSFDAIDTTVLVQERKLGVREHPRKLLEYVYNTSPAKILYTEEDVVLMPDTLDLCSWYSGQGDTAGLCLFNYNAYNGPGTHIEFGKLSSLGICFNIKGLADALNLWNIDPRGWDWSLVNSGLKWLTPAQSRSRHIGLLGGTYYRSDMYRHIYENKPVWAGPAPRNPDNTFCYIMNDKSCGSATPNSG